MRYFIDNHTINNDYLSLELLGTIIYNPVHFQQDEDTNNIIALLLLNPFNSEHKSSPYVHLRDYIKQSLAEGEFIILSINIKCLTSNLQIFVEKCLSDTMKFDSMGFSETRLENNIVSLFNIPGYNLYVNNRDRKDGGVCMHVSNIYNCSVLPD